MRSVSQHVLALYWLYIGLLYNTRSHTVPCYRPSRKSSPEGSWCQDNWQPKSARKGPELDSNSDWKQAKHGTASCTQIISNYTLTICRGLLFNVDIPGGCEFHTTWDLTSVASNVEVLKRLWGTHCPTQRRHIQPSSYLPALFRCNKALQTCICAGAHSSGASESLQADCPCGTWGKDAKCSNKSTRRTGTLLCYSASGNLSCNSQWPGIASRNAQIQDCS